MKQNGEPRRRTLAPRRAVNIRLDNDLADRLGDVAERYGVTRSMVARLAIGRGLKATADMLRQRARRGRGNGGDAEADA